MHKAKMILWGTVCIFFWVKYPSCLTGTAHKFWIFVEKRQLLLLASCSFPLLFNVGMASPLFHYITCQLVTALKQATTLTLQNEFTTSFANILGYTVAMGHYRVDIGSLWGSLGSLWGLSLWGPYGNPMRSLSIRFLYIGFLSSLSL